MGWITIARDRGVVSRLPSGLLDAARAALPGPSDAVPAMLPRHPVISRWRICGNRTLLTREHIPPGASGNKAAGVAHTIGEWLARTASDAIPGGKKEQGGNWGYTLCRQWLPAGMAIGTMLFYGPLSRYSGPSLEVHLDPPGWRWVMEVAHPPLAFLMTLASSAPPAPVFDIGPFTTEDPKAHRIVEADLGIGFGNVAFPGDYRSRGMIDAG